MKKLTVAFSLLISLHLSAQEKVKADTTALHSIGGIVKEMLRLMSAGKGKARNFEALRNLFLPGARFTILNHSDSLPQGVESVSLDEFMELIHDDYYEQGYTERELVKTVNQFNGIAHVFQSFEGRDASNEAERGMNSYQLVYTGNRWWIANILWTVETAKVKLPAAYLKKQVAH
ncbi:MAG: hypothetical protein QM731_17000 [Chitinophagaceae bacterium]